MKTSRFPNNFGRNVWNALSIGTYVKTFNLTRVSAGKSYPLTVNFNYSQKFSNRLKIIELIKEGKISVNY